MTYEFDRVQAIARERGLRVEIFGSGPPLLLLHGGGGPVTLRAFAERISSQFQVMLPTHPGFDGMPRTDDIANVRDLARIYAAVLAEASIEDLVVVGFSLGGWLAAELAASYPDRVASLILVDAVGIATPEQGVRNLNGMPPGEIADYSYHRPENFRIDPSRMSAEALAAMKANFATLAVYAEDHYMQDPGLSQRLANISAKTLVLWGESDRVVTPDYGRAYAAAIPGAQLQIIPECGHLPQLEQPAVLHETVERFAAGDATVGSAA
jgi:pimeloyl-ACP methyl ester carboxylesterase